MITGFINLLALLLSLSFLHGFIFRFLHKKHHVKKVLSGIVFGGICVVGMFSPIEFSPGVIFDPRSVVLSISGLFGGPIVAIIAAAIAGGYRLFLGGGGIYVGVTVIIASVCMGLGYRHCVQKGWAKINVWQLLLFGLLVHLVVILIFTQLPAAVVAGVMSTVAIPLVLTFTPATALLGLLLKDVEDRLKTENALRESELKLSHHLHNTPLAAITWDRNFYVTQWNKIAEEIFGYSAEEAIGGHATDLILKADSKAAAEAGQVFAALWEQKGGERSNNDNVTKDGRTINCEWYNTPILDDDGKLIAIASLCDDVTVRKQSELIIWQQAHYDSLTGLANRKMANDKLEEAIKVADRSKKSIAFLFLDLDRFKHINDTQGHAFGDMLLVEVSIRLCGYFREIDTLARFGGDEFVIIVGGLDSPDQVDLIASGLVKKMAEPFKVGQETVYISTSVGITIYPQDASDPVAILRYADQAMYAAKNDGGNRFQYFTPWMQQSAVSRMALISDLRIALPENQFQLYYQPIVDLVNGDVYKAEALIRWNHPDKGLIGPVVFVSIAEETKLILGIGDWVFHEASRQAARWRASLRPNFQISINTSPVQYKNDTFSVKSWLEHLKTLELPGDAIAVEITEGILVESGASVDKILFDFREANIQVSIDDFGTGYSSLSSLKKFGIDYLKIDKSFVDNLEPDSNDLALCEAMIGMAHKLDLKVIAEGIETAQQRDLLIAAGCDYGQGYLFSKPLPEIKFETLLKSIGGHFRLPN
ncbi:EAL domain-containing protein [Marinobacter psychrophilus]|jgi:diguanylate cyclase (GGDEF)-like protein/PAS domain S-box-containing protein|uniref:EAL domain-containing protein n=1 Tax=Marinobacter psychrophilus TaxID=330734 RepID=UPI001B6AA679|nr:EAL domain-containing protein [Marinobacter psychrophilus]MBQ0761778.1 EAL domain-containing protein [Marinobacter psychrophilus]MBQ0846436.1 EAL domain-containing protein [Marinobacter psychrophilus]